MYDFHSGTLPPEFSNYFAAVNKRYKYNTRLASRSSYTLPPIRTNYGKFSIKFQGVKIWNSLSEETKSLHRSSFKKTLKKRTHNYIDILLFLFLTIACHYSYVVNTIVFIYFIYLFIFCFCPGVMSACNLVMYLFISLFLGYFSFT